MGPRPVEEGGSRSQLAQLVRATGETCADALSPFVEVDWRATAARDLAWSVWDTVVHVVDDLYFYAAQVLLADEDDYICFEAKADGHADPSRLLAALRVHARLLAGVVETADPSTRGYHVHGVSDPVGFGAMGIVECLVHTFDAVHGVDGGSSWLPPDHLARPALTRLFRDLPVDTSAGAGEQLLHLCGRIPLGDQPRLTEWRWYGEPLGDAPD
ncbi:MAG TPA: hypothetical protein VFS29_12650 [Motilibacteraceae bacterium]|nr:hypothetical protein [Motilibacteraceae bacterium]